MKLFKEEKTQTTVKPIKGLRKAREKRGWSLRGLALKVGISPTYLSDIERGKRRVSLGVAKRIESTLVDQQ